MNQQETSTQPNATKTQTKQSIEQNQKVTQSENSSVSPSSTNQKWQQIIEQQQNQEQTPFLLKEQSFKSENIQEQYPRQKSMMQQAATKGRQFLINKNYQQASKQLSKTIMAFEFIAKNHGQRIGKQQLKEMMISTVLPTYSNLSLCYLKLKNYELVVSLTNQVLGQDPDNVKARYRRALAFQEMKRTEQAVKDYQMIKKLDSEMERDCNQKIIECRVIETEQRKRRKLAAQKFLSGYQSEDIKQNQEKSPATSGSQNGQANQLLPNAKQVIIAKGGNILEWVREKCLKCSKILGRLSSNKQKELKQQ